MLPISILNVFFLEIENCGTSSGRRDGRIHRIQYGYNFLRSGASEFDLEVN